MRAMGFIMRFGSVAIVFSLHSIREKTFIMVSSLKEGVDNFSASLCSMLRWLWLRGRDGYGNRLQGFQLVTFLCV